MKPALAFALKPSTFVVVAMTMKVYVVAFQVLQFVGKHSSIKRDLKPSDFDPKERFWI